jgi:hypothetical protein
VGGFFVLTRCGNLFAFAVTTTQAQGVVLTIANRNTTPHETFLVQPTAATSLG